MEKLEIKEVSSGMIDFRELQPLQPETYKKLGSRGFDRMWNALGAKGFRVPFQVWKNPEDGTVFILDGHQRRTFINALKDRGIPMEVDGQETFMVPVVYIFAESKKDAVEMLLAIDSEYGDRDIDGMLDMMEEYDIDREWMDSNVSFETFDTMYDREKKEALKAEEDDFQIPKEVETDIVLGDYIEIGTHRLVCGDSTKEETFRILFNGGGIAKMVVTDPPYNVDYKGAGSGLKIANDNMAADDFFIFLHSFYKNLNAFVIPGGAWYIWHADSEGAAFRVALKETGILFKQVLIWVKSQFTLGRQDYQWQHEPCIFAVNEEQEYEAGLKQYEPCLYGWKEGAAHNWYSDRRQSTILEFKKPLASKEHPTMKPVPLIGYQIENSSRVGDIVADGFGGSGTTMVACEQLKRICYMVEFGPHFCQVIVDRMRQLVPGIVIKKNGEIMAEKKAPQINEEPLA